MNKESIIVIILGLIGVAYGCLRKMGKLQAEADSANVKFNRKIYWTKDRISIISSVLSVAIWYAIFGEWAKKYPGIIDIKRTLFVVAGYSGTSIIQDAFDGFTQSAKKYIRSYVDVKTNTADMMTGVSKAAPIDKVIEKGNEITGADVTKAPPAPKDVETKP